MGEGEGEGEDFFGKKGTFFSVGNFSGKIELFNLDKYLSLIFNLDVFEDVQTIGELKNVSFHPSPTNFTQTRPTTNPFWTESVPSAARNFTVIESRTSRLSICSLPSSLPRPSIMSIMGIYFVVGAWGDGRPDSTLRIDRVIEVALVSRILSVIWLSFFAAKALWLRPMVRNRIPSSRTQFFSLVKFITVWSRLAIHTSHSLVSFIELKRFSQGLMSFVNSSMEGAISP